jgi:lambda repressor-like predicted transcriptional regulator
MMKTTAKKIKHLMIEKEVTGASIARKNRVTRTAVYHVISGKSRSPLLRSAIAKALGVQVSELWPD